MPEALVDGVYDDLAGEPVELETVRRCVEELWTCCVHLGVRPEEKTIAALARSRLTGIVKGARSARARRSSTGPRRVRTPALDPVP